MSARSARGTAPIAASSLWGEGSAGEERRGANQMRKERIAQLVWQDGYRRDKIARTMDGRET